MLLARGKPRHVGVLQNVRAVFVIPGVRHRKAGLVEQRCPFEPFCGRRIGGGNGARVQRNGHRGDARRMRAIDAVTRGELVDGRDTDVAAHLAPEEIVENAEAQRAADRVDAGDAELGERRRHDGKAGASTGTRSGLSAVSRSRSM